MILNGFLKKSFFRIGMWHSRPPRDPPPPLHGKCHLKFPFWLFEPFPYKKKENIQSAEEKKKTEKEKDQNVWRRKIFSAEEEVEISFIWNVPTLKSFRLCKWLRGYRFVTANISSPIIQEKGEDTKLFECCFEPSVI